ncbi:MAG: DUF882 domain-containing protein [Geminicoccaceae bacterium]
MTEQALPRRLGRRRFVSSFALPLVLPSVALPSDPAAAAVPERSVDLYHCHTGESLKAVYFAEGRYQPDALIAATHHLRDWRDNTELDVDPAVLDLLWSLRRKLEIKRPLQVFCGYRSPETNAMLRRTRRGVAAHSLHMRAMAIDLRVEGRPLSQVRRAAVALRAGGVGYYPRSGFVHVDTGGIRYW